MGFEVDVINSVQFSNHTGYPSGWEGEVLDGSMLRQLVDGMDRNGLLSSESDSGGIGNILTGYIGSESFLRAVVSVVQKLKDLNPKCRYICDPVLGDMGKFYVPKELVDIYRRDVLPLVGVFSVYFFMLWVWVTFNEMRLNLNRHAYSQHRLTSSLPINSRLSSSLEFPYKI